MTPLPWKQTHKPQFTDFSETTIQILKDVYYGERVPDTGMHACMETDHSKDTGELITKDQRFLIKDNQVWVKASTSNGIEWRTHIGKDQITDPLLKKVIDLEGLSVWSANGKLFFYDQNLECQYELEGKTLKEKMVKHCVLSCLNLKKIILRASLGKMIRGLL